MNYFIRSAEVADAEQIAQIQVDSYRSAYGPLLPAAYLDHFSVEEQTSDWEALIPSDADAIHLVAETEPGRLIGYAYSRPETYQDFDCELIALHVRKNDRNSGVGKRLFFESANALYSRGCRALFLWVLKGNPAIEFYLKLGGKIVGMKPWGNNGYFGVDVMELAVGWPQLRSLGNP